MRQRRQPSRCETFPRHTGGPETVMLTGYNAKMFEEARLTPGLRFLKQSLVGDLGGVLWVLNGPDPSDPTALWL